MLLCSACADLHVYCSLAFMRVETQLVTSSEGNKAQLPLHDASQCVNEPVVSSSRAIICPFATNAIIAMHPKHLCKGTQPEESPPATSSTIKRLP